MPNINIVKFQYYTSPIQTRRDLCLPALGLALKYKVDFVDAHHRRTMKLHKINEIYSLDCHFDRFPSIKRLEAPGAKP